MKEIVMAVILAPLVLMPIAVFIFMIWGIIKDCKNN